MDKPRASFNWRASVSLIVAALMSGAAIAADDAKPATAQAAAATTPVVPVDTALSELTTPKSTIEAGVLGVTERNWKFGQYNGLPDSGPYGIGGFDIQGGGAYDSDDASRWRITGKNIGLETREFSGEYKDQGKYKLKFGYDEIFRFGQGSYQTPYIGAGGNTLSLPSNWNAPGANTNLNMRALGNTRMGGFQDVDLFSKRRRTDGGFSYFLTPEWEAKASFRHEDKNGLKALGAPIVGLRAVILPDPISQATDQINASMNFTGDKAYAAFAYYGSLFHNDIQSVTFENAYNNSVNQPRFGRMSSMPDNQFHQFNLTGGYNFSSSTKLVGNGSYGRNWQDQSFLPYGTTASANGLLPRSNLSGDVETKAVNLKLTHKFSKDLNLSAAYKFDERANNTPISLYSYRNTDALTSTVNLRSNTPYSKSLNQVNLDADYSFAKGHWLKAGYDMQNIDRWCNGTWISCADTGTTTEHTGRIDYRGIFFDKLNSKVGYAYSHRTADNYNQDNAAWATFSSPAYQALYNRIRATGLTGWGPALGFPVGGVAQPFPALFPSNNLLAANIPAGLPTAITDISDIAGLGRFNTANRTRQKVHSYFDYQATEKLSLGMGGDFHFDSYPNSQYGLQSSRNLTINLDGTYNLNENTTAHLFYTYQDNNSKTRGSSYGSNTNVGSAVAGSVTGGCYNSVLLKNNNAKIDPCLNWLSNMSDNIDTVGFGLKRKGLLNGKLDLNGDFLYSFARTLIDVSGGQYVANPIIANAATNGPVYFISAAPMPEVKTQTFQFKLDSKYNINKASAMHLTYLYQRMLSNDYIYTGMSYAGTPQGVMPTNEKAPKYSTHAIGLSYIYNF